ncbi:AHH domain-containing protein [Limnoraphis robusta]|uniref:Uncharacterized protein n=1 Tax=Limnoraphis robusta CS-951 TaxID=1637645 RepID=A0A0J9F0J9_9CYAN|nr:AHH domain-containing protein [Limnoraphis robusta]KMW70975.1 hypothetical protein WN50_31205 [Limnoraphis robusta CS-951]
MGQEKRYFENITIDKGSLLSKQLNIEPGDYFGEFDCNNEKLLLTKQRNTKNRKIYEMTVTYEQLLVILIYAARVQGDKFTPEDLAAMTKIIRKSSPIKKSSNSDVAHHIIPLEVCEKSKLILAAKRYDCFDENSRINFLKVPLYFHIGAHPKYSKLVEDILDDRWSDLVECGQENDRNAIREVIEEVIQYLTDMIKEMKASGVCIINDI